MLFHSQSGEFRASSALLIESVSGPVPMPQATRPPSIRRRALGHAASEWTGGCRCIGAAASTDLPNGNRRIPITDINPSRCGRSLGCIARPRADPLLGPLKPSRARGRRVHSRRMCDLRVAPRVPQPRAGMPTMANLRPCSPIGPIPNRLIGVFRPELVVAGSDPYTPFPR